jgi:ElaB/YqjD/DUF883 family membrane-anchored ribosome-binding protein
MENIERNGELRSRLMNELRQVISDAEDMLRNTGQQAGEGYQLARSKFESTLSSARDGLSTAEERLVASTRDAMETADEYVRENPWQAVGAGALAGLVVGLFLGRR